MPDDKTTILTLGAAGAGLIVSATRRVQLENGELAYDISFHAEAYPFSGTFVQTFTAKNLRSWRARIAGASMPGALTLGGDRAAELRLSVAPQNRDPEGRWAVEVSLTPSSDDPHPFLRFLIFDVEPFAPGMIAALDALARSGASASHSSA